MPVRGRIPYTHDPRSGITAVIIYLSIFLVPFIYFFAIKVNLKPINLSYIEAASILYCGLTSWSALWLTGGLCYKSTIRKFSFNNKILILGGSGGVGTLTIQLAKAWNLQVIATCRTDAVNTLKKLGADTVIIYDHDDAHSQIINAGPYDIILDCCNLGPDYVRANGYTYTTYITLNSPLLKNIDDYGVIRGSGKNLSELIKYNIPVNDNSGSVKWGFFSPSKIGINFLQKLVENKQLVPVVEQIYSFRDLPEAYRRALSGHSRGKLVIDIKSCYAQQ